MDSSAQATLRTVVREYLADEHPTYVEEFEVVFPELLKVLKREPAYLDPALDAGRDQGLPFDLSALADVTVALAVLVAAQFLKAAMKVTVKHDIPKTFDTLEKRIASATERPELVKKIRSRVERILREL